MKQVTITEIATKSGADTGTVSRILSGRARRFGISKKRADLVMSVARELGYVPNTSAQAFRTGRFGAVAMILGFDEHVSYLTPHLMYGLDNALAKRDMHLVVSNVPAVRPEVEALLPRVMRTSMVDGILINYTYDAPEYVTSHFDDRGIPYIWINSRKETNAVHMDDIDASRQITQRLLDLGHKRIDYVDPWAQGTHHTRFDREQGYSNAMVEAGLEPRVWKSATPPVFDDDIEPIIKAMLNAQNRPTAVIAYWFNCVPTIIREASVRGLRVPEDLSIATFGPERMEGLNLKVSAMLEQTYTMGTAGVEMLCEIIDGDNTELPSRKLPYTWCDGGTIHPVP
ncbi:MAG TPA: LacI family DNA-binding transcriptional regulator [Capsulimonadaceae bacterium]|jgi:LacI family transcriptional regulator